jgi:hypothetical protein
MDGETAQQFINQLFRQDSQPLLSDLEAEIVKGIFAGKKYQQIADETSYGYLRSCT